jgi:hypothetical protein
MTLSEKQRRFTRMIADLIVWAYAHGYELTFGEALRTQAQANANAASGAGRVPKMCRLIRGVQWPSMATSLASTR